MAQRQQEEEAVDSDHQDQGLQGETIVDSDSDDIDNGMKLGNKLFNDSEDEDRKASHQ